MPQVDSLGREVQTTSTKAQTVTGFAVEQGTLDGSDSAVKDALREEERRRKERTEHAERVSAAMAPAPVAETSETSEE